MVFRTEFPIHYKMKCFDGRKYSCSAHDPNQVAVSVRSNFVMVASFRRIARRSKDIRAKIFEVSVTEKN